MSIVPVNIRAHLIPFLFQEFEGKEASYLNKKVTAIKISTKSSIGRIIRLLMVKVDTPVRVNHYQLYLEVVDTPAGKEYHGTFYKFESGKNSFLELPTEVSREINCLLEDIFRTSFCSFVYGYMKHNGSMINAGIDEFIRMYDLLEFGFTTESMRQLYYREKKKAV